VLNLASEHDYMKKRNTSQSGLFNPRIFLAFSLCSVGVLLAMFSFATTPSRPTLSVFGGPDPTVPGNPRYQIFASSVDPGFGEFNIGFNPATGHIFTMNSGAIYRITTPERRTPVLPECCAEVWEDKSATSTITGLDPILWTDQKTGRTFASNSTVGANALYAYTDTAAPFNDGDVWVEVGAAPASGTIDHETLGSGPYPASLSALTTPVNKGEFVLYCAQDGVGSNCQRSDDLGSTYGPGVPATGPGTMNSRGCGGLHGHVHIAPDGSAWLPDKSCGGSPGGAISVDAGAIPWTEFTVPASAGGQASDPSIAFDEKSTAYYCYVSGDEGENHAHVAVGKRTGTTIDWIRDVDVGASHGIVNVVFPEAIAGSEGRAACGFLGTNVPGDFQGTTFTGDWYLFIATTYDEGQSWMTVNATPNNPVQRHAGICLRGINCGSGTAPRNLEDFNEVTMDDKGRVLFGYSAGPGASMRVARQIGGKTLLTQFDVAEPALPKAPCLSGTRNTGGVHLSWKIPDNGGADIIRYRIFRGTAPGNEVFIGDTGTAGSTFDDVTANPAQPVYYVVRAVNNVDLAGGAVSNEINLPATPGIWLQSIGSRMSHGGTPFDVDLPLYGIGIECRSGAAGNFTLVFTFANPFSSVSSVNVTSGTGAVNNYTTQSGALVVNLTGVTNAQRLSVTLTNARDSVGNTAESITVTMGVLLGDVNANKLVTNADVSSIQAQVGATVTQSNFRNDVNANGTLSNGDVAAAQAQVGAQLPP
jgi:hypothetical protein